MPQATDTKVFSKKCILKTYFENNIIFYIFKILCIIISFCYFQSTILAVLYFVFSKY